MYKRQVIFLVPFVEEWPYKVSFTTGHLRSVLRDKSLLGVYRNSLLAAFMTAFLGAMTTYAAALSTARSHLPERGKRVIENISLITNTIPGMVVGIAYIDVYKRQYQQRVFFVIANNAVVSSKDHKCSFHIYSNGEKWYLSLCW